MRLIRIVLLAGVIVAIILVAALVVIYARIPSAASQIPSNSAPIVVVLSYPTDGSEWPSDTPVPVTVMVTGQAGLTSVELWVDGRLFDTQVPLAGHTMFYHAWSWLPLTEGAHAVFVRAMDENGRTADSNAVHIQATAAAGLLVVGTAQGGETFQSLAEQNGVTVEQIAAANPALDPAASIPPGTQLLIPVQLFSGLSGGEPVVLPPQSGPVEPAVEGSPNGAVFLLENTLNLDKNTPAAPTLSASVGVCNVTLTIQDKSDDESGFFIYALSEASVSFKRITSLNAHTGTSALQYTVPNQRGHVQFYVSAYNTDGESPSAPAAVDVTSPQCNPSQGDQGDLKYAGGFLTLPPNVQLAYFYASINGGKSQRIPDGDDFLEPISGQIDLRTKIQQLLGGGASGEVDLDVWGWSGGALIHLGKLHLNINFASLAICNLGTDCSGDMGSTHWVNEAVVGSDKTTAVRAFRWSASGIDIDYAIWMVSTQPFPAGYSVGAPPGLVISGISEAEVNNDSGVAGGKFEIDFNTDLQFTSSANRQPLTIEKSRGSWQPDDFKSLLLPDLAAGLNYPPNSEVLQAMLTRQLYIRAMPMAGGHPASDPSNTVHVTYTPTGEPPPIHIYKVPTYKVEIVPDSYINEVKVVQKMGVLGCSDIISVDHDVYVEWYRQAHASWPISESTLASWTQTSYQWWADRIGWQACPGIVELPEDTVWDFLGVAFKYLFDSLSSALEEIKGTLVNAIASIIPGCDKTCKMLLMTGLNFTITYFTGLPPSIPNFDEVVSMGIDYAVQVAISQAGIPYCDATCQALISDEIQTVAKDVAKSGKSQPGCAAQNKTYWVYEGTQLYHLKPLCFPPGVVTQPLKGSMYESAMVAVRVTRIDGSMEPVPMQNLVVDTFALNAAFADGRTETDSMRIEGPEHCTVDHGNKYCYKNPMTISYNVLFNAPLVGVPFPQKTITVPALKAGQSVDIPVVFENNIAIYDYKPPNVYPPRLAAVQSAYPEGDLQTLPVTWWMDYTHLTDSGSQVIVNAKVLCQDKSAPKVWNSPCSEIDARPFMIP